MDCARWAIVVTTLSVVERLVALNRAPEESEAGGANIPTLLDSTKGLITALGQAPACFVIFLAAILLLWAAPTFFGNKYVLQPASPPNVPAATEQTSGRNGRVAPADLSSGKRLAAAEKANRGASLEGRKN